VSDETKWTPAEVRGLVNDVLKWVLLVLSLWFGVDAKVDSMKSRAEVATVKKELGETRRVMGLPVE
jgi:hypothetical protein